MFSSAKRQAQINLEEALREIHIMSGFDPTDPNRTNQLLVIDLTAALHSMNAPVLAKRCDAVIVVARYGRTTHDDLDRVIGLLKDARILGVVLNRKESRIPEWVQQSFGITDVR